MRARYALGKRDAIFLGSALAHARVWPALCAVLLAVLSEPDASARQATVDALREAGVLDSVRVLQASTPIEGMLAASAACSIAEACGGDDALVVIDSLRGHLSLWTSICQALKQAQVAPRLFFPV